MDKKDNFENTFDHQDWKQVIVRKKKTKGELNTNPKPSQASQKAKSIEKKADEGNLKHKHITKELRLQIQQARNSKGLTQKQFDEFRKFFETMPKLKHEVEIENPKTKVKSKVTLQGIQDFFGSASPTTA